MTGAELTERCKNRNFDRIIVVTRDIFTKMANMQKIQKDIPGNIYGFNCLPHLYRTVYYIKEGNSVDHRPLPLVR